MALQEKVAKSQLYGCDKVEEAHKRRVIIKNKEYSRMERSTSRDHFISNDLKAAKYFKDLKSIDAIDLGAVKGEFLDLKLELQAFEKSEQGP